MAYFESFTEALKNPQAANILSVDVSRVHLDDSIVQLSELTALRLTNCPKDLVLPEGLRQLKKLRGMEFSGPKDARRNKMKLVIPRLASELSLEELEVREYEANQLAPFTKLKSLNLVTDKPKEDVAYVAKTLPNLIKLGVFGSNYLKGKELPPEIGYLIHLEELDLNGCGLSILPSEMAQLSNLRKLALSRLPMDRIPDIVCELTALEVLVVHEKVADLPANMPQLKKLRDFTVSFLECIPNVLTELTWLEKLLLTRYNASIDPLKDLVNLKLLNLFASKITMCDALKSLVMLENLDLTYCDLLEDMSPLANLKNLHTLNIGSTKPISLAFLKQLPVLRHLDIDCIQCSDISPIFDLELETLRANDEILERWRNRDKLQNLPALDEIKPRLGSQSPEALEKALCDLAKYVIAAGSGRLLGEAFGNGDQDRMSALQAKSLGRLDEIMETFGSRFLSDTLVAIANAALQNITEDNYRIVLIATVEIIRRKDLSAQMQIVEIFKRASGNYDAGHRHFESTAHDQLIDKLLPKFEAKPLAVLLDWCSNDHLDSATGDRMDALFIPAFTRVEEEADFVILLARLQRYVKQQFEYERVEIALDTLFSVESNISPIWQKQFTKFCAGLKNDLGIEMDS